MLLSLCILKITENVALRKAVHIIKDKAKLSIIYRIKTKYFTDKLEDAVHLFLFIGKLI